MIYLLLLLIVAYKSISGAYLDAAFIWSTAVAVLHAREEAKDRLWSYFGKITGANWLTKIGSLTGFILIVFPALLLQIVSSVFAFGDNLSTFWLSLLIGLCLGDAIFSHLIAYVKNIKIENPGIPTSALYLVNSFVYLIIWHGQLINNSKESLLGLSIGIIFFASVQPLITISKTIIK